MTCRSRSLERSRLLTDSPPQTMKQESSCDHSCVTIQLLLCSIRLCLGDLGVGLVLDALGLGLGRSHLGRVLRLLALSGGQNLKVLVLAAATLRALLELIDDDVGELNVAPRLAGINDNLLHAVLDAVVDHAPTGRRVVQNDT